MSAPGRALARGLASMIVGQRINADLLLSSRRLATAGPDMLEALAVSRLYVLAVVQSEPGNTDSLQAIYGSAQYLDLILQATQDLVQVDAAIAKATGAE